MRPYRQRPDYKSVDDSEIDIGNKKLT